MGHVQLLTHPGGGPVTVADLGELQAVGARAAQARAFTAGIRGAIADDILELSDLILAWHEAHR